MTHYPVRVIDGKYVVGATTDGRDFHPVPGAEFDKPRHAYQHSDLLELGISPLRASEPGHRIEPEQPGGGTHRGRCSASGVRPDPSLTS